MSTVNAEMFRAYDIRGVVGEDLTEEAAVIIGKGIGTYMQQRGSKRLVVGQDNRPSSENFKKILIDSLRSTGCDVVDIGLCTSPMQYVATIKLNADGGVMVTASHNPAKFNGFKMVGPKAFPIGGQDIQDLLAVTLKGEFLKGSGSYERQDTLEEYISTIVGKVKLSRPLKVALDTGNGVAGICMPRVLKEIGCEVVEVFTELDGRFPNHLPNPEEEKNLLELKKQVVSSGSDIGIGIDGDGDRVGIVNEKGEFMEADYIIMLLARDYLERHPGDRILVDVKTSQNTIDYIKNLGGKPVMWKTGHSLVKQKMREDGIMLGGELSGHMFVFENYFPIDDAAYAASRLLSLISRSDKKVSEYFIDLPKLYSTRLVEIPCADNVKFEIVDKIRDILLKKYEGVTIDGLRVTMSGGWALIRASNTAPNLTLRFEANSPANLKAIQDEVMGVVKQFVSAEPHSDH
jgi:phosphomannomutase / phosphoglucomutase